jgi:hypothetical protein
MTSSKPLPFSSLAMWLTEGNFFRQSGHQVAQKNSMTTFPQVGEMDFLAIEIGQRERGRGGTMSTKGRRRWDEWCCSASAISASLLS